MDERIIKPKHGGQRPGAGRPRISTTGNTARHTVTIAPDDLAYLLSIDKNLSKAIRDIIQQARIIN